jgi:benzodiazapine receptor
MNGMDRDLVRQISNVVAYGATLVANGLAVALPLNGNSTAELSDRFPVLVTPANYVFSIWTLIYILLGAFAVYQALPRMRTDTDLRAIGYLPVVAGVLNTLWIVLWHFEVFAATVPVMLALLATLILIHLRLRSVRSGTGPKRWLVGLPFSVYLGWITVATIANISQMLYWTGFRGGPLSEDVWAVIVLATGVVIAAVMLIREADWAYALVIVWAYLGIAAKQTATAAVAGALVGAIVVALLIAWVLYASRTTTRPGRLSLRSDRRRAIPGASARDASPRDPGRSR